MDRRVHVRLSTLALALALASIGCIVTTDTTEAQALLRRSRMVSQSPLDEPIVRRRQTPSSGGSPASIRLPPASMSGAQIPIDPIPAQPYAPTTRPAVPENLVSPDSVIIQPPNPDDFTPGSLAPGVRRNAMIPSFPGSAAASPSFGSTGDLDFAPTALKPLSPRPISVTSPSVDGATVVLPAAPYRLDGVLTPMPIKYSLEIDLGRSRVFDGMPGDTRSLAIVLNNQAMGPRAIRVEVYASIPGQVTPINVSRMAGIKGAAGGYPLSAAFIESMADGYINFMNKSFDQFSVARPVPPTWITFVIQGDDPQANAAEVQLDNVIMLSPSIQNRP